jgi:hypothetical protein
VSHSAVTHFIDGKGSRRSGRFDFDCSRATENQAFAGMEAGQTPRAGVHPITPRHRTIRENEINLAANSVRICPSRML